MGSDFFVRIQNQKKPMCCIGCKAVAQTIVDAGAVSFYERRSSLSVEFNRLEALRPWIDLLADPAWSEQHVHKISGDIGHHQTTLALEGLRCGACAWLIERTLGQLDGVIQVRANASTERLYLQWMPSRISLPAIAQKIMTIGYAVLPVSSTSLEAHRQLSRRRALQRIFIAGLSAAQIMMYAYPEYLEGGSLEPEIRSLMRTASMLITTPVMLFSAQPFFESAYRAIAQRRLNMDVPVSLGLLIAFGASLWAWWTNTGEVYFDSVSMFVFLLLVSRWIESKIQDKAASQRTRLAATLPSVARRLQPNPGDVAVWNLQLGDIILVRSGERLPADGVLLSEQTDLDTSWLTGESLPVHVLRHAVLTEGSINLGPEITMRIHLKPSEGTLTRLSQMAEAAAADRPNWLVWADEIGAKFTAALLLLSVTITLIFVSLGVSVSIWLSALIAILVVTCPCALSMAGPTAYAAALARLLERGIAVSSATSIEKLLSISDVVFDKTGTLTEPTAASVQMVFGSKDHQQLAQRIAAQSHHPISIAIARMPANTSNDVSQHFKVSTPELSEIIQFAGLGLSAMHEERLVRLGSLSFVTQGSPVSLTSMQRNACSVYLSINGELVAGFSIGDEPRTEAAALIKELKNLGITVWCLSGDSQQRVNTCAASLGIPSNHVFAEQTPELKRALVVQLQQQGRRVLMVGDGYNDAPVLAQADLSIAVQGAAALAQQKADIYCLTPGLSCVPRLLESASQTRRILRQNIAWAVVYNLLAIPFAAAGMITPLLASAGMALSSLVVVLNSGRLLIALK
jgi:Cu2+-exporting ATPase